MQILIFPNVFIATKFLNDFTRGKKSEEIERNYEFIGEDGRPIEYLNVWNDPFTHLHTAKMPDRDSFGIFLEKTSILEDKPQWTKRVVEIKKKA